MTGAEHPVAPDREVIVAARSPRRGESVYHLREDCGAAHQLTVTRRTELRALNGRWRCCRYCHPEDDIRTEQARSDLSRQECPKCGESYGQLPQHLVTCDGDGGEADA
jgi:DNA polymerase III alpha subunit (gram-positive type)